MQGGVAVRRPVCLERPARGEGLQPLGEQPDDERSWQADDPERQRDVRALALRRPVRRRRAHRTGGQGPHEAEQVVVGPALVDVLDVQADHDGAHALGSAHIGFV